MQKLKAIVACADIKTENTITNFLTMFGYDLICKTQYGFNCIEDIMNHKPDVVICDAFIYDLDACRLYEQLKASNLTESLVFVVASSVSDSSLINSILASGVDMFTLLPTDFISFDSRIRELVDAKANGKKPKVFNQREFDIKTHIKHVCHELGISPYIVGYDYIVDAIYSQIEYPSGQKLVVTKNIYPTIAQKYNTTASGVEMAIRNAIEKSWLVGNYDLINEIFAYTVDAEKGRPSNSQYICAVAEKIKIDFKIE